MNTPITDAAVASDESVSWEGEIWIDPAIARRLETDRAALMDSLDRLQKNHERITGLIDWPSTKALAAARSNFPTT